MRFAIKTFGCKVNQYESAAISAAMRQSGFEETLLEAQADILIVNSCTVTADSDKKALREVRRFKRAYPEKVAVLTGCFPQAFPEKAASSGADLIAGTGRRADLPEQIRLFIEKNAKSFAILPVPRTFEELTLTRNDGKTRAFLKIEDGCDRFCAYCIIPTARGRVRSRSLASIQAEARRFAENGHKEIVLTGINLSCYGQDLGLTLADAVEAVCATEGVERVRLSSLEPELLDEAMLARLAALEKLCPHFHLSLQSGCDETLRRMNRHYTAEEYWETVVRLRALFPGCAVTTDIMVGFPGETEEEFAQTLAFAEKVGFAKIHAFAYSPRGGTTAARRADQIPQKIKTERFLRLTELDQRLHHAFLEAQIGTTQSVLIQKRTSPDYAAGLTPNYTPVRLYGSGAQRHDMISVKITGVQEDYCVGSY